MADVVVIKDYLKKLQKIIMFEAEFKFPATVLIKKNKVDDVLCCLLASLPDNYKKTIRTDKENKFPSINSFRVLNKELSRRFFFNSNYCMINADKCNRLVSVISTTIEKDINIINNL